MTDGMVGRVYRWRGEQWRVLARWASPRDLGGTTWVCVGDPDDPDSPGCGTIVYAPAGESAEVRPCCATAEALRGWHWMNDWTREIRVRPAQRPDREHDDRRADGPAVPRPAAAGVGEQPHDHYLALARLLDDRRRL